MANYSALTFQDAWHHEICTLDHTSVCYVSLSKYLHMMPFWRQPDHYISRFYGDSTLQKLDAVTPDGDTAHHKKTIESEKLRASQNHNDTSKGCKLVAQPRPLLFSRHALCSRRSQRTGTDVCHCNSHIEKTWSRLKKKKNKKSSKHAETSSGCVRTAYLETVLEHPCAATKSSYSEEAFIPSHLSTELSTELSELKASFCSSA